MLVLTGLCAGAETPAGRGTILCEYFRDTGGSNDLSALMSAPGFPDRPTQTVKLPAFEIPENSADNYGTQIRGYIHPPASGNYTFWIAADDTAVLFLSNDEKPEGRETIALVPGASGLKAWSSYKEQQSRPIQLSAGKKYYIEALHKEGGGGDHLAVGWQLPDGTKELPIPGSRLSPATR